MVYNSEKAPTELSSAHKVYSKIIKKVNTAIFLSEETISSQESLGSLQEAAVDLFN